MIVRVSVLALLVLAAPAVQAQEFFGEYATGPGCQGMDAEISRSRVAIGPFECKVKGVRSRADGAFRIEGIQCRDGGDAAGNATLTGRIVDGKVFVAWAGTPDVRLYRCER